MAESTIQAPPPGAPAGTRRLTYGEAVNAALRRCLAEDDRVIVFGEDVALPGGVFGVTRRLAREFGDRVFDTPISESAILGGAVGAAMMGMRPVVEIMWADFSLVALDQLVNQAANVRYVSRGEVTAPIVVRTQQGNAPGACAQHSQSLEALYLHVPGLRVVMPRTAQDAGVRPPGWAHRRRAGDDVTVVSWGALTSVVLDAADALAGEGVTADVLELPWLNPMPLDAVLDSVRRTRRLVVVHEAVRTGGFGAEVVARVVESGVRLDAPVRRVTARDSRIPAAPVLAQAVLPGLVDVVSAVRESVRGVG
jgi:pyruvate/2-oxoglutarate/acetoin dehydrogenase E1 component